MRRVNMTIERTDAGEREEQLVQDDVALHAALDELGAILNAAGFDLETRIEDGREIRGELLLELHGIDPEQPRES